MSPNSPQGRLAPAEGPPDREVIRPAVPPEVPVKGTLHSVERALRALELVASSGDGITAKAVARRLGCTLSTSYNVLNTLVAAGYLVRLPEARGYGLGYQVASLTRVLWDQLAVNSDVRNVLARLHAEADAPAYLAVYRDADVVVGHIVDSTSQPRVEPIEVGYSRGAHATAYGKVLLAALPVTRRRALLNRAGMPAFTEHTCVDPARLNAELDGLAVDGLAVEVEEFRGGVAGVAAPVRLCTEVVGALAVSVPVRRFEHVRGRLEDTLRRYAADIAVAMSTVITLPQKRFNERLSMFRGACTVSRLTESWPLSHRCARPTMNGTSWQSERYDATLAVANHPRPAAGPSTCGREPGRHRGWAAHRSCGPVNHLGRGRCRWRCPWGSRWRRGRSSEWAESVCALRRASACRRTAALPVDAGHPVRGDASSGRGAIHTAHHGVAPVGLADRAPARGSGTAGSGGVVAIDGPGSHDPHGAPSAWRGRPVHGTSTACRAG
ncbi:MAG TPA: IclR family transcriptional regulator [Mycobacteriales bacterium]